MAEQIANHIEKHLRPSAEVPVLSPSTQLGKIEIRLKPKGLGRLTVRMSLTGDKADVGFVTADVHARSIIESTLPRLRELLAAHGISLEGTQVDESEMRTGDGQDRRSGWQDRDFDGTGHGRGDERNEGRQYSGESDQYGRGTGQDELLGFSDDPESTSQDVHASANLNHSPLMHSADYGRGAANPQALRGDKLEPYKIATAALSLDATDPGRFQSNQVNTLT